MSKAFNPLLDRKKARTVANESLAHSSIEMNAAEDNNEVLGAAPNSPISGRPMIKAYARDVPVWVDPSARLVLPVKAD